VVAAIDTETLPISRRTARLRNPIDFEVHEAVMVKQPGCVVVVVNLEIHARAESD